MLVRCEALDLPITSSGQAAYRTAEAARSLTPATRLGLVLVLSGACLLQPLDGGFDLFGRPDPSDPACR
jgi:hypothetical protein